MKSFIIVLALSLTVSAQTPEDRLEQKAKDAIPQGPYKDGIYQYE